MNSTTAQRGAQIQKSTNTLSLHHHTEQTSQTAIASHDIPSIIFDAENPVKSQNTQHLSRCGYILSITDTVHYSK